jgi:hypothetical protein
MKKILLILLFLSNGFASAWCQSVVDSVPSKPVHSLSLGLVVSHTALKDETVSPLIFSGIRFPLNLTYRRESVVSKQYFQLYYQSVGLTTTTNFNLNQESGGLVYGYLRRLKSWKKTNLFVGAEIQLQGFKRDYIPASNSASMVLLNAFNLTGLVDYLLEKHKFEAQITLTAIGYNIRPMSNFFDNIADSRFKTFLDSGKFESIPDYLNASFGFSYQPPTTSKHIRWRFDYWGNFYQFKQQQYFGVLQNQLTTSFTYQF